ncbi:unnamed protein product [Urochloa humidicola]
MPCVADELREDSDGELGVHHATRRGSAFPSLSSGGGSSSSSTSDLVLELSVLVHGGDGRIRSSSVLSVEGPAGVKQGRRGGSLKASGSGSSSDWWGPGRRRAYFLSPAAGTDKQLRRPAGRDGCGSAYGASCGPAG